MLDDVQRRALWFSALAFTASALVTVVAVRQVSTSAAAREARMSAQLAADVADLVGERERCLHATIDALRGALATNPAITADQWRTYTATTAPGHTCRGVSGMAYIAGDPPRVVHRSDQQGPFAVDEAVWLRLFAALHPTELEAAAGTVFGPTQAFGSASFALLIAAVPGAGPASPPRGWAALLVSPGDLFDGLVDPVAMRVRVEDRSRSRAVATVLDTIEPEHTVVLSREVTVGGRPLRLSIGDARPTAPGLPTVVGVVAGLGALQTLTLAWLVYRLAASRERPAFRAAADDASLGRDVPDRRPIERLDQVQPELEPTRLDAEDIIDPAEVLLRCNQNGDVGARMLQLFADSLPAELDALESAAAASDMVAVDRIAHKMRGGAATLAAVRLAAALESLERFLEVGDGGPLADRLADVRHESARLLGVVPQTVRRLTDRVSASSGPLEGGRPAFPGGD